MQFESFPILNKHPEKHKKVLTPRSAAIDGCFYAIADVVILVGELIA